MTLTNILSELISIALLACLIGPLFHILGCKNLCMLNICASNYFINYSNYYNIKLCLHFTLCIWQNIPCFPLFAVLIPGNEELSIASPSGDIL